jgi:hypothetical protein
VQVRKPALPLFCEIGGRNRTESCRLSNLKTMRYDLCLNYPTFDERVQSIAPLSELFWREFVPFWMAGVVGADVFVTIEAKRYRVGVVV